MYLPNCLLLRSINRSPLPRVTFCFAASKFTRAIFRYSFGNPPPPLVQAPSRYPRHEATPDRFSARASVPPPFYQIREGLAFLAQATPRPTTWPATGWQLLHPSRVLVDPVTLQPAASRSACTCRRHVFAPSAPITPRFRDGEPVKRHAINAARNSRCVPVKACCQDSAPTIRVPDSEPTARAKVDGKHRNDLVNLWHCKYYLIQQHYILLLLSVNFMSVNFKYS